MASATAAAAASADVTAKAESAAPEDLHGDEEEEHDGEDGAGGRRVRKRRLGVDPSLIISDGRSKRRRTPSPGPVKVEEERDPKDAERAAQFGREIYNKIMDMKDKDGESMADPFIKLPSKRQFPDYYEVIKHPMSLDTVDAKLSKKEYQTLKDVVADIGQIFNNAKRYNVKESLLFAYAKKLHKMTRTFYAKHTNTGDDHAESDDELPLPPPAPSLNRSASSARRGSSALAPTAQSVEPDDDGDIGGPSGSVEGESRAYGAGIKRGSYMKNGPTTYKLIKPVLKSIKDARAKDGSGREIAGIFESLPDRRDLPDYYAAIKNPISLQEIEERMVARKYETWEEFFEAVELMCANAMEYNEDGSEVYQDAVQIREILDFNRAEIRARLSLPVAQQRQRLKPVANTPARASHASYGTPGSAGGRPLPNDGTRTSASPLPPGAGGYYGSPHASTSALQAAHQGMLHPGHQHSAGPGMAGSIPPPNQFSQSQAQYHGQHQHLHQQQLPLQHQHQAPSHPPQPYLRALPTGIVSEEVVNSLSKYPLREQQAWVQTLAPPALAQYRQYLTALEARRRIAAGQQPPPLADPPSSGRNNTNSVNVLPLYKRNKPNAPGIKCFEFTFNSTRSAGLFDDEEDEDEDEGRDAGVDTEGSKEKENGGTNGHGHGNGPSKGILRQTRQSIRLHNLRGVGTHALLIGSGTTEVEIIAYFSDFILSPTGTTNAATTTAAGENGTPTPTTPSSAIPPPSRTPDVTLRLNGVPSAVTAGPASVYEPIARFTPDDEDGNTNGEGAGAGAGPGAGPGPGSDLKQQAKGVKWTVQVPSNKSESRIEVLLVRQAVGQPGAGSISEASTIYVVRQF